MQLVPNVYNWKMYCSLLSLYSLVWWKFEPAKNHHWALIRSEECSLLDAYFSLSSQPRNKCVGCQVASVAQRKMSGKDLVLGRPWFQWHADTKRILGKWERVATGILTGKNKMCKHPGSGMCFSCGASAKWGASGGMQAWGSDTGWSYREWDWRVLSSMGGACWPHQRHWKLV